MNDDPFFDAARARNDPLHAPTTVLGHIAAEERREAERASWKNQAASFGQDGGSGGFVLLLFGVACFFIYFLWLIPASQAIANPEFVNKEAWNGFAFPIALILHAAIIEKWALLLVLVATPVDIFLFCRNIYSESKDKPQENVEFSKSSRIRQSWIIPSIFGPMASIFIDSDSKLITLSRFTVLLFLVFFAYPALGITFINLVK